MANIIDSYSETNQDNGLDLDGAALERGQTFTGNGATLGSAIFYLKKGGTPTGTAFASIYAITGTFGTSAVPTGSALATSDTIDVSTLTTSYQLITLPFSGINQITLTNATHYAVTITYTGTSTNKVTVGADGSAPGHAGNTVSRSSGGWGGGNIFDHVFYVDDNAGATTTSTSSSTSSTSSSISTSLSSTSSSISTSSTSSSISTSSTSSSISTSSTSSSVSTSISTSSTSQSTSTSISTSSTSISISTSTSHSTSSTSSSQSTSISTSSTSSSISTSISVSTSSTSSSTSISSTSTSISTSTTLIDFSVRPHIGNINLRFR